MFAKTYYVATRGSNENPGTIDCPFGTITFGISQLSKGDTLYVLSGTYNERVYPYEIDGTADNPIVISAYPGGSPIIDGTGIRIHAGGGLVHIGSAYTHLNGFEVQNANINGEYDGSSGIVIASRNCIVSNCIVHNTYGMAILAARDSCIIENCSAYNISMSNEDQVRQEGEIWSNAIAVRGSSSSIVSDCIIRHCLIHDAFGEGYTLCFTDHCIIEDCVIYDAYAVALYVRNSKHSLVQRNLVYMSKDMGKGSQVGIGYWNEGIINYTIFNDTMISKT